MDAAALKISLLFLLSVCRIPEVWSKNNKIKIIVPHKISIIHHHHSKFPILKPKKIFHADVRDILKTNQIHHQEEESEEDLSEEKDFGHDLDEREEASQRGGPYYAIPVPEYSNAVRVYMKPVFLYNDPYGKKHVPRHEYHRYEDYNYPEETYHENRYHVRKFQYK